MAFITMSQYAIQPAVTSDKGEYINIRFGKDHRVGLTRSEAISLAADLLEAADARSLEVVDGSLPVAVEHAIQRGRDGT